jgi:isopentenyl-diphosphate delta-isomerase
MDHRPVERLFDDGLDEVISGVGPGGELYPIRKLDAHTSSIKHLAVSIFLFRDGKLLLQQRASGKYHAPLLWANSACSHPLFGETPDACAHRITLRELGLAPTLNKFTETVYESPVGGLFEHEHVHCYCGTLEPTMPLDVFDRHQVDATRLMSPDDIAAEIATHPDIYAPWFRIYVERGLIAQAAATAR